MKRSESLSFPLCLTFLLFEVLFLALGCTSSKQSEVVAYVSEDQVFSEPIL